MSKQSNTKILLEDFFCFLYEMTDGVLDPKKCRLSYRPYYEFSSLPKKKTQKAQYGLKRQGYCFIEFIDNTPFLIFTVKAQHQFIIKAINKTKKKLRNGKLCFVSFDIPVKYKKVRDGLREVLKGAGFKKLHDSFWYSDKDVADLMRRWIEMHDASDLIAVIEGKKITK